MTVGLQGSDSSDQQIKHNSPGLKHQWVYSRLQFSFYEPLKIERRGLLLGRCGVRLSASTLVVPDILFVSRERRSIVGEAYIDGAPDLLGEIISPTTDIIDRVRKRDLYARHGVRHYWLAHPEEEWLRAYELGADGHYGLVAEGHGNMAFSAPPFPSLTLQLGRLWSERPARDPR